MVNALACGRAARLRGSSRREPVVKSRWSKTRISEVGEEFMPVHRKRFRIEEAFAGNMPAAGIVDGGEPGPMHSEIMAELRAIRAQMAGTVKGLAPAMAEASVPREVAETQAML